MNCPDWLELFVSTWSVEHVSNDKLTIELEGKTKCLATTVMLIDADGKHLIPLIPEFQGAWMRVRITVENISEPEEP